MPRTTYPRIARRSTLPMFTGRTSGEARGGAGGAWATSGSSRAGGRGRGGRCCCHNCCGLLWRDSTSAQDDLLADDCAVASCITAGSSARELNVGTGTGKKTVKRHRGEPGHTRTGKKTPVDTGGAGTVVPVNMLSRPRFRSSRGRAVGVWKDGCEVRLCDPCARVRPCVPCVSRVLCVPAPPGVFLP